LEVKIVGGIGMFQSDQPMSTLNLINAMEKESPNHMLDQLSALDFLECRGAYLGCNCGTSVSGETHLTR